MHNPANDLFDTAPGVVEQRDLYTPAFLTDLKETLLQDLLEFAFVQQRLPVLRSRLHGAITLFELAHGAGKPEFFIPLAVKRIGCRWAPKRKSKAKS